MANALDPGVQQKYVSYITTATPGQFKPIKLYVLPNDPTCMQCVTSVRANTDLDQKVEIIDATPLHNRPSWLKGVPSLMDNEGKFYLGPECVMWIRYQASQSLASIQEMSRTSDAMPGGPAVMDGAAALTRKGALTHTSSVPQQFVTDQDLLHQTIQQSGGRTHQMPLDQLTKSREQIQVAPPPGWRPGQQLPREFQPQQVARGGNAGRLNGMMEQMEQERKQLLAAKRMPHHMQQRASWGGPQTQTVQRGRGIGDQQLQQLQQQRDNLRVPMRQPYLQ